MSIISCVKRIFSRLSLSQLVTIIPPMSKKDYHITSVADVIDALGGTVRASEFFMIGPSAVSMMRTRGIPSAYHLRVYLHLVDQGYRIDTESVFGYSVEMLGNESSQQIAEMHAA